MDAGDVSAEQELLALREEVVALRLRLVEEEEHRERLSDHLTTQVVSLARLEGREARSLDAVARSIAAWQAVTFPGATVESVMAHLRREVDELAANPMNGEEMADVFHLLVALCDLTNVDLADECRRKLEINRRRDWMVPDGEGCVEHVREADIFDQDVDGGVF
jgi:hypothetical protein